MSTHYRLSVITVCKTNTLHLFNRYWFAGNVYGIVITGSWYFWYIELHVITNEKWVPFTYVWLIPLSYVCSVQFCEIRKHYEHQGVETLRTYIHTNVFLNMFSIVCKTLKYYF
jgi:hypothetical protein